MRQRVGGLWESPGEITLSFYDEFDEFSRKLQQLSEEWEASGLREVGQRRGRTARLSDHHADHPRLPQRRRLRHGS